MPDEAETHHSSDGLVEDPGGCSVVERTGLFGVDDMSLWKLAVHPIAPSPNVRTVEVCVVL